MDYITAEQLEKIMPHAKRRIPLFISAINATLEEFDITTPLRIAAFLAQIAHESGELRYVKELASGEAYEGRVSLGNSQPGFGVRYKGRGLIQLTGYNNYLALMMTLDIDCVEHPELLEQPINACRSAGWWWKTNNANRWADRDDVVAVSGLVNTGSALRPPHKINGMAERRRYYEIAKKVLGV